MSRASLKKVSEEFIEQSAERQKDRKTQKLINLKTQKQKSKFRQTLYFSKEVNKILWQHRVDTGESLSSTVARLVLKYLK